MTPDRYLPNRPTVSAVRAEYSRRFPAWSQQWVTIVTGKALTGQQAPSWLPPTWFVIVATLFQFPVTAATTLYLVSIDRLFLLLLPIAWLLSVNALRKSQVTLAHHAIHHELTDRDSRRPRPIDTYVQTAASVISLSHNYWDYYLDHVEDHHSRKKFTTAHDPDAAFLLELGFRPGMSRSELWRKIWTTPISPAFHCKFITARVRTNLLYSRWAARSTTFPVTFDRKAARLRCLGTILWILVLGATALTVPMWIFLLVVVVPLVPLYHVSALLQFVTEHGWLWTDEPPKSMADYASRTWGRFCIEPLPVHGAGGMRAVIQWIKWTGRFVFVQLPWRFAVLVGDLPAHDLHHLHASDKDWRRAIWNRQIRIDEGLDKHGMADREYGRFTDVANAVFGGLSEAEEVHN